MLRICVAPPESCLYQVVERRCSPLVSGVQAAGGGGCPARTSSLTLDASWGYYVGAADPACTVMPKKSGAAVTVQT